MKGAGRIREIMADCGVYEDCDVPVMLTSGGISPYKLHAERLLQDDGEWEQYQDDPSGMIDHAIQMMEQKPAFGEVIDILAERADALLPKGEARRLVISGGQRKDWILSGPVADKLDVDHIGWFKPEYKKPDRVGWRRAHEPAEYVTPHPERKERSTILTPPHLLNVCAVHVSDLLTEAASAYHEPTDSGWIPMLRRGGAEVNDLIVLISRKEGGEENLARAGVRTHSAVDVDDDYLRAVSRRADEAVAYQREPKGWAERYIRERGVGPFVRYFDPKGDQLVRAQRFVARYGCVLGETGRMQELRRAVARDYTTLPPILDC